MKVWALIISVMAATSTAMAANLAQIQRLDCRGANASAVVEIETGTLRGQIRTRTFNNNTIQVVELVADLPSEEFDALGGSTVGRLGVGQIYVVFNKQQSSNLSSNEAALIMHMDSDGNLHSYPAQCTVTL